jgi:hypothetical protein
MSQAVADVWLSLPTIYLIDRRYGATASFRGGLMTPSLWPVPVACVLRPTSNSAHRSATDRGTADGKKKALGRSKGLIQLGLSGLVEILSTSRAKAKADTGWSIEPIDPAEFTRPPKVCTPRRED